MKNERCFYIISDKLTVSVEWTLREAASSLQPPAAHQPVLTNNDNIQKKRLHGQLQYICPVTASCSDTVWSAAPLFIYSKHKVFSWKVTRRELLNLQSCDRELTWASSFSTKLLKTAVTVIWAQCKCVLLLVLINSPSDSLAASRTSRQDMSVYSGGPAAVSVLC